MEIKQYKIKEQINASIKGALYSNFSNATEATQEIIDNSVSHRIPGKKMTIRLMFIPKSRKLVLEDIGGSGMNINDLESFFRWGETKERGMYDIGLYGQGGKSAIGYLGNSFSLITSPVGKKVEYRIKDDNLGRLELKEYDTMALETNAIYGYTKIEIGELKITLTQKFKEKLTENLVTTYRPLIESGEVSLEVDGEHIKTRVYPLEKDFSIEKISIKVKNNVANGWVGRLAPRTGVRGGIRCYYKGRLICDREFFGHPDPTYKGTLNFLFGELHLDFVSPNTNKTDFKRDTQEWQIVESEMFNILHPHIDELLGRKVEEPDEEDVKRIKKAKELYQRIMEMMQNKIEGLAVGGENIGQKRPEKNDEPESVDPYMNTRPRQPYNPKTSPPENAIGSRKRLRKFMDWEIRNMDENIRSKIEERDGGKILIVNKSFPGYTRTNGNDFYLLETAALQTVPIDEGPIGAKIYLEEFDKFFARICENMDVAKDFLAKSKVKRN